jgi:regulator of sigma D
MSDQELVQRWLAERRHLLIELVGISRAVRSRGTYTATNIKSLNVRLAQFCDRLVDYVSAGHFEVYADLTITPESARLLGRLWQQLKGTTDKVLAFNERVSRRQIERLPLGVALAELSLALEDRFTIEDRLVVAAKASEHARAHVRVQQITLTTPRDAARPASRAGARASTRVGTHQASHRADPVGMNATTVRRPARQPAIAPA